MSKSKKWNKQKLAHVVQVLSTCLTVEEACEKLNISSRQLRRAFSDCGMMPPASYLRYVPTELSKKQKEKITQLYSEIGGALSASDIAEYLKVPLEKVKEYISKEKLTHKSLPYTKEENIKALDSEKVEKALEIRNYKLKAHIENVEIEKIKLDANKWQTWKENVGRHLFSLLSNHVTGYKVEKIKLDTRLDYAGVLSIQDFHLGRYAARLEVGKDTNLEIQEQHILECVDDLVSKVTLFGAPEKLYLTVGGDFVNSDNSKLTTTSGTPQDSIPSHVYLQVRSGMLYIKIIDRLRQVFPVIELVPTPGNHDRDTSVANYMFVSAWYRNSEDIVTYFDNENATLQQRQYRRYGNNLLAFMHGDGAKLKNAPVIIANEARDVWGETKHTILLTGHHHYRISQDLFGIQHVQVPSLALDDRWSNTKAYQNEKGMTIVLIDHQRGYMAEIMSHPR
jgi:hypothetical protein